MSVAFTVTAANHVDLWLELKRRYLALRGGDPGPNGKAIPRTTRRDVLDLATRWTVELAGARGDQPSDKSEHKRWRAVLAEVERGATAAPPNAIYPGNAAFWDGSSRLAIYLESLKLRPSRWDLAAESLAESFQELPTTIRRAGATTAGAVGRFLGDPLRLGAVVLGAAIVVPAVLSRR